MATKFGTRLHIITLASASALALSGGAAWAQAPPSVGGPSGVPGAPPLSAQPSPRPAAPAANPLTLEDVSKIKGTAVLDNDDKKIGTISTMLMRPASKTIDRLVVGEGGLLGVGTHYVALPVDAFTWDSQAGAFKLAKTAEDLRAMPEWQEQIGAMPEPGPAETPRPSGESPSALPPAGPEQRMPAPDLGRT